MALINKSRIKEVVQELQKGRGGESSSRLGQTKEEEVTSVADEVGIALEKKVENILNNAVERAKANKRRTLQGRDI